MFFEESELEIKNQLKAHFTGDANTEVLILPEKTAESSRSFLKRRVTVCYKKSTFQNPSNLTEVIQDEAMQFELVLTAKVLRGENGIFDLAQKTLDGILGFRPSNGRKVYAKSLGVEDFRDNLWYWTITIEYQTTAVQTLVENYPLLNTLTFNEV